MRTKVFSPLAVAVVAVVTSTAVAEAPTSTKEAAKEPPPLIVAPSEQAKQPPPKVPQPASLASATGFGAAALEPFAGVLPAGEREQFERSAAAVLGSPFAAVIRQLSAELALERKTADAEAKAEAADEPDLFSFTMPDDPTILLGAAKTVGGQITASPRLVRGALPSSPQRRRDVDAGGKPLPPEDEWIYQNPEQACTSGLSYALVPQGSVFSDLESLPAPSGLDVHRMNVLYSIEGNPSPLLRTGAFATDEGAKDQAEDELRPDGAPAAAADDGFGRSDPYFAARGKELPLTDFLAGARAVLDPGDQLASALLSGLEGLEGPTQTLRRTCVAAGNKWTWTRATGADHGDVTLFACRTPDGRPAGPSARLLTQGGDYPYGLVLAEDDAATGLGVELRLAFDRELVQLTGHRGKEPHGPSLTWTTNGQAAALDLALAPDRAAQAGDYDVYEWYPGGAVKLVGHRRAGHPAGAEKSWYEGGALAGQVDYDDKGVLDVYREWFENHRPAEETHLVSGKMSGVRRWWHPNGLPAGEVTYADGEPHGPLALWYEDGTKGVAAAYRHAQLDGDVAWFYEDGSPLFHGRFKAGRPDGDHKLSLDGGGSLSERHFADGQPLGTWTSFDLSGKPLREVAFKNGQKDGRALLRYKDGSTFLELTWKDGLLDGPLKTYYPRGQLAATCVYEKDMLVQFSRWYPNGQSALEGKVVDQDRGVVTFSALRQDGSASLECSLNGYEMDRCRLFDKGGQEIRLPGDETLTAQIKPAESGAALAWEPGRCGGYKRHVNYDALINNQGGDIVATFDTNHECPDRSLGEALSCVLTLDHGRIRTGGCTVGGFGEPSQGPANDADSALAH